MVIIFILLGLGFVGGGIALIVEGWPYMVLERGFTQVIAGTVLASAGVILLALSRVLSELRRTRSTLSNALMAASLASMATREEPALSEAFALEPIPRRDLVPRPDPAESLSPMPAGAVLGGAAAGVLAGAVLARAGAGDHDAVTDEKAGDVDLFGVVAPPAIEPLLPSEAAEPMHQPADEAEQLPFDDAAWLDRELAREFIDHPPGDEAQSLRSEVVAEPPSSSDADPFAGLGEHASASTVNDEARTAPIDSGETEFDFLRESLAHLRTGRDDTAQPQTQTQTPIADADGDIRDAAAWMSMPSAATAAPDRPVDALERPAWPPATQSVVAETEPYIEIDAVTDRLATQDLRQESQASSAAAEEGEGAAAYPTSNDADVEADAAIPAEPPAPAASDEGVIGAYQVGDAHFTIYADGSIQARTPDGDYRFASMDELKTYLASEKSRLGM